MSRGQKDSGHPPFQLIGPTYTTTLHHHYYHGNRGGGGAGVTTLFFICPKCPSVQIGPGDPEKAVFGLDTYGTGVCPQRGSSVHPGGCGRLPGLGAPVVALWSVPEPSRVRERSSVRSSYSPGSVREGIIELAASSSSTTRHRSSPRRSALPRSQTRFINQTQPDFPRREKPLSDIGRDPWSWCYRTCESGMAVRSVWPVRSVGIRGYRKKVGDMRPGTPPANVHVKKR